MPRLRLFVVLLAAAQSPLTAQLAKPVFDRTPSGIPRVMSAGPTAWKDTLGWKLVLDHTVQPADGAPGELAQPRSVALYVDGRLAVAEEDPAVVNLYDATGKFVRMIGREGSGPGEYRVPTLFASRDRLVVQDMQLSRATLYTLDGRLIRSFPSTCCNGGPTPFLDDRTRISTAGFTSINGKSHSSWIYFDTLGRRVDSLEFPAAMAPKVWTFAVNGGSATYSVPLAPTNRNLRLPDGSLVHGRTDRFEFFVTRTGRDTLRIFGRTGVSAVPIASKYRDSLFHVRTDRLTAQGAKLSESDMPTEYDLWNDIARDGAGNFWIHAGGGRRGPARFDVFAPSGAFLGSVASPWGYGLTTSWVGDRVAVIDEDGEGLPRVRVFRIVRTVGR